jgi:hypothetical protein
MTAGLPAGLALVLLLAACSTGAPRTDTPVELTGTPGCFNIRDVQDFRAIDRSRLVVFAPNDSRAFQLRISPPSPALRGAPRIAFDSRSGRICGRAGESIYFDTPGSMRYAVTDVRRLDQTSAALLGSGGSGPKADELEPETDTAADIEPLAGAGEDQADKPSTAGEP